jgi:hypothetical protein
MASMAFRIHGEIPCGGKGLYTEGTNSSLRFKLDSGTRPWHLLYFLRLPQGQSAFLRRLSMAPPRYLAGDALQIPVEAGRYFTRQYLNHTLLHASGQQNRGNTVFRLVNAVHEIGHCGNANFPESPLNTSRTLGAGQELFRFVRGRRCRRGRRLRRAGFRLVEQEGKKQDDGQCHDVHPPRPN